MFINGYCSAPQRYLILSKVSYILKDLYEGVCGSHTSLETLVYKVLRQGYF